LSNVPDTYTMTSLNGLQYTLSYLLINGNQPTYFLQSQNETIPDELNYVDGMRANGVVHSLPVFYLPPGWTWPLPSVYEFITQFSSFNQDLVTSLMGFYYNGVNNIVADIVTSGMTIPTDTTVFLLRNIDYVTRTTDPTLFEYHFLPGQYLAADLPLDVLVNTVNNGSSIRIVNYQDTLWVNGYSSITIKDIVLADGIIHIIDLLLSLPVSPDDPCVSCFKDVNILDDIANDTTLSSFYAFILNSPVTLVPPYTLIVPSNNIDFGRIASLNAYLATNITALQEYMQQLLFDGLFYPTVAYNDFVIIELSVYGTNYSFVYVAADTLASYPTVSFVTNNNTGSASCVARPRKDGVYYVIGEYLFTFPVPPPPPTVTPVVTPVPEGVPEDSNAVCNYQSILFLLLGYIVVLFLQ